MPNIVLTDRELEIVRRYTNGTKQVAIAFDIGVTEKTVNKHLERIYLKLGIHDRSTLTHWAIYKGHIKLKEF